MKKLILLMLVLITPLRSYDDSQYLKKIFFAKDIDFKPVYIKNLKLDEFNSDFIPGDDYVFYQKHLGYKYLEGLDVSKYNNKNLGYIFEDLNKKFEFIYFEFSNFQIKDSNSYEDIQLIFKYGDNFIIEVFVYAEADEILKSLGTERNLESLFKVKSYFAIFTKLDLLTFYCKRSHMDLYSKQIDGLELEFLIDSLSKTVYDKIINAGIVWKCE